MLGHPGKCLSQVDMAAVPKSEHVALLPRCETLFQFLPLVCPPNTFPASVLSFHFEEIINPVTAQAVDFMYMCVCVCARELECGEKEWEERIPTCGLSVCLVDIRVTAVVSLTEAV